MDVVEVKIGNEWYKAEQEVVNALQACNATSMQLKKDLEELRNALYEMKLKEETAKVKKTRTFRMVAWEAKQAVYSLLPRYRVQELFK